MVWGFFIGFKRGLIRSIFSVLALFLGVIGALQFSSVASIYIHEWLNVSSQYLPLVSFIAVFLGILIVVKMLAALLDKFIKFVWLGPINKVAGGLFWTLLMAFIFSTVLWFLNQATLLSPELKTVSRVYFFLEPISPWVLLSLGKLVPFIGNAYESLELYFDSLYTQQQEQVV